jgi:predicted RNase H-like HicB family nuclease
MSTRKAAVPSPVAQHRYSVQRSPEDQEFVATVHEFPSLSWLDEDEFEALRGVERLVSDVIKELKQSGEPVPQP